MAQILDWISVKEQLPPPDVIVLVTGRAEGFWSRFFKRKVYLGACKFTPTGEREWEFVDGRYETGSVTYWMPLPEIPR